MGIIDSTTDQLKRIAPDLTPVKERGMGIINSTTDKLKRNAPALTPVKDACRTSYDYCWGAITKVDKTVRVDGLHRLTRSWPDDESRAKIGLFATKFGENAFKYALREGVKCVPGGDAVFKIVSQTIRDVKSEKHEDQEIKALLEKKGGTERDFIGSRKLLDQAEIPKLYVELNSQNAPCLDSTANQKPEDMIRIYMMKEFMGRHILSNLLVPGTGKKQN